MACVIAVGMVVSVNFGNAVNLSFEPFAVSDVSIVGFVNIENKDNAVLDIISGHRRNEQGTKPCENTEKAGHWWSSLSPTWAEQGRDPRPL